MTKIVDRGGVQLHGQNCPCMAGVEFRGLERRVCCIELGRGR